MQKITLITAATAISLLTACGGGGDGEATAGPTGNSAPLAIAGTNQTTTVGAIVQLDGSSSSDADKDALTYKWTLTSKPTDSAPLFGETNSAKPTLTNTRVGTYVLTLVVNDGKIDSTPSTVSIDVSAATGPISARAPTAIEVESLTKMAVDNIPLWLKSPSTFKMIGSPAWSYYDTIGKPNQGAITVDFDSQNGFGATIRTKAICGAEWDSRGFWRNTLTQSLALCVFL